jgi:6-phosphofructokinase 1
VELLLSGTKGVMLGLSTTTLTTTLLEMVVKGGQKKLNNELVHMAGILGI